MLIKHQSFDIFQSRKSEMANRNENLYEEKKYRYLKFIIIPGISGFMLLCILMNVNFTIENERTHKNENITRWVGDNRNFYENATELWNNANNLETGSYSHESFTKNKGSKSTISFHQENSKESHYQHQFSKEILHVIKGNSKSMKLLPTAIVKSYEVKVFLNDLNTSFLKPVKFISKDLNLETPKAPQTFHSQELNLHENELLKQVNILPIVRNGANKSIKSKTLNIKFVNHYEDFGHNNQETNSIQNNFIDFANDKVTTIGSAISISNFPLESEELLATDGALNKADNAYNIYSAIISDKELLTPQDTTSKIDNDRGVFSQSLVAKKKSPSFANQITPEVDNTRSTIIQHLPNNWDNFNDANLDKYEGLGEYKENSKKNIDKPENLIKLLQNSVSENINGVSNEFDSDIKIIKYEEEQKTVTDVKVLKHFLEVFKNKIEHISENLVGNAISLNFKVFGNAKDKNKRLKRGYENKSYKIERNFILKKATNAKRLLRATINHKQFKPREVTIKPQSASKLSGLIGDDEMETTQSIANLDLSPATYTIVREPSQYPINQLTADKVGNALSQFKSNPRNHYKNNFPNTKSIKRAENASITYLFKPEPSYVKVVPCGIANHLTESSTTVNVKDVEFYANNDFIGIANSQLLKISKYLVNTTRKVGNVVAELNIKETHDSTKKYFKYFYKQTQISKQISSKFGNALVQLKTNMNERNAKYSQIKSQLAQLQNVKKTKRLINPGRNVNTPMDFKHQRHENNKHLPLANSRAPARASTMLEFLNHTRHSRITRQVESDRKINVTTGIIKAIKCTTFSFNCTLICDTGSVSHLDEDLENLQIRCFDKDLTLELRKCIFLEGIMKTNFLNGFYRLQELQIINCNLMSIQDGAFEGRGVRRLQTLKLINNSIASLTATTFDGLTVLKHFEFSQRVIGDNVVGTNFLTPMAPTLTNIKIMQTLDNNGIVDPMTWLDAPDFETLYIADFGNNNLQGVLKPETFLSLVAVRLLHLQNCSLHTFDMKPFEPILDTLYYLILNNNYFLTLDPIFLNLLKDNQVILVANANKWQCDCDNRDMIDYMKTESESQYIDVLDYLCENPQEWKGIHMKFVSLSCEVTTATEETRIPTKSTTEVAIWPPTTTLDTTTLDTTTSDMTTSPTKEALDITTIAGTTDTAKLENITCRSDNSTDLLTISLKTRTADLTIHPSTSTSCTIMLSIDSGSYRITYFHKHNQYLTLAPTSTAKWTINNLNENQSYIFCLVQDGDDTVSPFDCWGHFMGNFAMSDWLLASEKGWFASVIVIAAILFCIFGGAAVYFVVRQRPSWVFTSSEWELLAKRSSIIQRVSSISDKSSHEARRVSYISPEPQCDRYSNVPSSVYASRHKPPTECAPTVPGVVIGNSCNSQQRSDVHHNFVSGKLRFSVYAEENDYGYSTINHYEEVKF